MDYELRAFVARCARHRAAIYPAAKFVDDFRKSLDPRNQAAWPRGRVLAELATAGFPIGELNDVQQIGGIAPAGKWSVIGGRLEMV